MTTETAQRPSVRISFRLLIAIALGLAVVAFVAGRQIYTRYGSYRPLALTYVPPDMRYRARVEAGDVARLATLSPVFRALDPRGTRWPALQKRLGWQDARAIREVAFGLGPAPTDFVLVIGVDPAAAGSDDVARAACDVLGQDGIHVEPTSTGCRLSDGTIVGVSSRRALLVGSREALVQRALQPSEIGDRLGFSGPSVRGVAPGPEDLTPEAGVLAGLLAAKFP